MNTNRTRGRQTGVVFPAFAAAAVVLVGVGGLAVDLSNAYATKSQMQNVLDAAALSGAKVLMETRSDTQARAAVLTTFNLDLPNVLQDSDVAPLIEFSDQLDPFAAGGLDPKYVRVRVEGFTVPTWFARVLPGVGDTLNVRASAVAGPSPPLGTDPNAEVCNIAPMMLCGTEGDSDCSDGSCFGYSFDGTEQELKTGSNNTDWEVGPGNFQLIELECGTGAACVRDNLAGSYGGCTAVGKTITTEPGNTVGPVAQGLNTRFGIYNGPVSMEEAPPDLVTDESIDAAEYFDRLENGPHDFASDGVAQRRVMAVPFGDCSSTTNGRGDVPVLGLGCFFLTRHAAQNGGQTVWGQFVSDCKAAGTAAEDPEAGPTGGSVLYKIVLYKDPGSRDS